MKKGFTDKLEGNKNPALAFISTANTQYTDNNQQTDNAKKTEDERQADNKQQTEEKPERKSKRLNLLIRPSLLADLYKVATMKETSINDLICMIIDEYNQKEAASIKKYNEVFKK
jgi:predicted HicB family RNase H-like nuclease